MSAGFSSAEPWLPLADDAELINVARQQQDARSFLYLHRNLIATRRSRPTLQLGSYRAIEASGDLISFAREWGEERIVVALNLGSGSLEVASAGLRGRVLVSTGCDREGEAIDRRFPLHGDEGLVVELAGNSQTPVHFALK